MERNNAPQATSAEASACGLSLVQGAQGRTTAEVLSSQGPQGAASTRGAGVRFSSEFCRILPSMTVRHGDAPLGWSQNWSHPLAGAANHSRISTSKALRGLPWAQGVAGSNPVAPTTFSFRSDTGGDSLTPSRTTLATAPRALRGSYEALSCTRAPRPQPLHAAACGTLRPSLTAAMSDLISRNRQLSSSGRAIPSA